MSVDLTAPDRLHAVTRLYEARLGGDTSVDRVARLTSRMLDATAQVSLLLDRQIIISACGELAPAAGAEFALPESLCARVVARAGPFMIDDLREDQDLRAYPAVADGSIRSYLAVPLVSSPGFVIGTLAVFTGAIRTWTEDDRDNLDDFAASVVTELEQRAREVELEKLCAERDAAAITLQRSLLPAGLGHLPELVCAARYKPGTTSGVGGDWYDVVDLGAGRSMVVLGDVMGRGLRAAAFMGQLRSAARAYARLDLVPGELLSRLDGLVADDFADGAATGAENMIATCVVAVHEPADGLVRLATAGHPAPLLLHGAACSQVPVLPGPILGVGGGTYAEHEVVVGAGDVLAFFTDGLVERKGHDYDAGIDALARVLSRALTGAETDRAALEDAAGRAVALGSEDDDVALLLVAPADRSAPYEEWFPVGADDISTSAARSRIRGQLRRLDLETVDTVELVASEMIGNALKHPPGEIQVRIRVREPHVYIEVAGAGDHLPSPTGPRVAEDGKRVDMVAALARRWGQRTAAPITTQWAEIRIAGQEQDDLSVGLDGAERDRNVSV